ncbi:hypothetical protein DFH09DRAFT_1203420 [Mycena vulgaris]|nr:hypothetical protein DFH09DRAFT_1203420 [Mycena vulgaris]
MFATSPLILLLAASLASAASPPIARTTTYQVCRLPSLRHRRQRRLVPFGLWVDATYQVLRFGDLGSNGFITKCFYDNSGALVQGTEFCPPGPVAVTEPPNCLVVTE